MRVSLVLLTGLALVAVGCKRRVTTAVTPSTDSTRVVTAPADTTVRSLDELANPATRLAALGLRNLDFTTLSIRGSARFENGSNSQTFSYRIHLEKGKRLWAVASVAFIEGARVLATPGQCQVIVRLQRRVYLDGYAKMREQLGFNVDYALLEDVLLGNLSLENPLYQQQLMSPSATLLGWLPGPPMLSVSDRQNVLNYFLSASPGKVGRIVVVDSTAGPTGTLVYDRFQPVEAQLLPYLLSVEVTRPTYGRIVLQHREVQVNPTGLPFSFALPADYEQVR